MKPNKQPKVPRGTARKLRRQEANEKRQRDEEVARLKEQGTAI